MAKADKKTILIIEDETINLNILVEILRDEYTLILEKNGTRAIERAENQIPDLILLDIMLPDLDGYSIITAFKNNDLTKEIPVIFISSLNEVKDEEKGLMLGAVDYIVKPYNASIIKARVRTHMKLVTQRKLLERIAMLDGLTEIPNRRSFSERFAQEWNRGVRHNKPLSLIIADVDYFKQYNDYYGHGTGDVALKSIANVFVNVLGRSADFAARIGGEEFAILLPETTWKGGFEVAEKVRMAVEELHIMHECSPVKKVLTVSLGGITLIPNALGCHVSMFEMADQQLYEAKACGKNMTKWHKSKVD
ncbi:diguanylate cyclase [Fusibacter sp. 3D3]|uniref:GGDEF domain-containing response regulator n=1 Tax=Fusibacter sp. 3D3 TaxID=1048380 RepID=UPI000852B8E9|nr:diguanylate cyclase [Fusibacter sp. 3D3]GAU79928.1 response regulator [Fusibacter sp. 3D3]